MNIYLYLDVNFVILLSALKRNILKLRETVFILDPGNRTLFLMLKS